MDHAIAAEKAEMRRQLRSARLRLDAGVRAQAARDLAAHVPHLAALCPPGSVAGYIAIRGEADPMPLMQALAGQGWRLALPRVEGEDISFRGYQPGDALACGGFGLTEPQADAPVVMPDLVLAPLLAFDRQGGRLGYGGGYYDRALARMPQARVVGIAYAAQEVARVPMDAHDRRLSQVLTERGVIDCHR